MEVTKILPYNDAAKLQTQAGNFDCRITDLAVVGNSSARISISGTSENLNKLFENTEIPMQDSV